MNVTVQTRQSNNKLHLFQPRHFAASLSTNRSKLYRVGLNPCWPEHVWFVDCTGRNAPSGGYSYLLQAEFLESERRTEENYQRRKSWDYESSHPVFAFFNLTTTLNPLAVRIQSSGMQNCKKKENNLRNTGIK